MDEKSGLIATLTAASNQFTYYAIEHLKKSPPDFDKVLTNLQWAKRCIEAIGWGEDKIK